jgi:hypothetical protein
VLLEAIVPVPLFDSTVLLAWFGAEAKLFLTTVLVAGALTWMAMKFTPLEALE